MAGQSKARWSSEAKGFLAFLRVLALVAVAAALYAVAWLLLPPSAARLPPGATQLELRTQESHIGSRLVLGCPTALFPDVRLARQGSAVVFVRLDGGVSDLIWPAGWSARLVDGRAELVSPDGDVIAREGDLIRYLGGGNGGVCLIIGSMPRVEAAQ